MSSNAKAGAATGFALASLRLFGYDPSDAAQASRVEWIDIVRSAVIAGIEVKCAYFTDRLKTSNSSAGKIAGYLNKLAPNFSKSVLAKIRVT